MRCRIAVLALNLTCLGCLLLTLVGTGFGAESGNTSSTISPSDVIFQIGRFDHSSSEFASSGAASAPYVVGRSVPEKDWPSVQPIELPGAAPQPAREISFSLEGRPALSYRLHLGFLIESSCVPAVEIHVNGKSGRFYLHPELDYSGGDQEDAFNPAQSYADLVVTIPGSYLHSGNNTLTLRAIAQDKEIVPGAGLTYDAIELDRVTAAGPRRASVQIVPTIFFKGPQETLAEVVDVFLRYGQPPHGSGDVVLTIEGKRYRQQIQGGQDFGEEKFEFSIPEFRTTQARVTWNLGAGNQSEEQMVTPARKWTLYLVPHIHLDIGYSDYQAKVAAIQSRVIDEAMDLSDKHPDFCFSMDGEWDLQQFMQTRSALEQQRAIKAIQKKLLFIPAQYANLLTGFPTAETLLRSLYPSARFSQVNGTPFNYANITDVPSYSWSYASILASAGIKYLLAGSDNYRGPVLLQGRLNENSPMYWEGPDGQKVLLWYSRHYMQMQFLFGLPPLLDAGHDTLPLFLQQYERPAYRANAAILFGTQVENTDLFPQQAELADRWNAIYAYPRIEYSGFHDALQRIAQQFGDQIPVIRGDGGPYWEDGIASDAFFAAMERKNESRGPSAEKLSTLTSLVNTRLAADKKDLDAMWTNMVLMDEHTWTADRSVSDPTLDESVRQLARKDSYAERAASLADFVARNSMASLADSISAGSGSLIVFNTLNWPRTQLVALDLNNDQKIVDKVTGKVVPYEVLREGNSFRHVQFVAADVPAMGYKVFELAFAKKTEASEQRVAATDMENQYYSVQFDASTGAIRGIYDKQLQRELVDQQNPYRFGQYLYVTGGDKTPNSLLQYSPAYPAAKLTIHAAGAGHLESIERTPSGLVARLVSSDTNTPAIRTEVRLFDSQKKIEITEEVDKTATYAKEGVYFAFPFAMPHPRFQYEIQTGVVDPAKDMYAGAGHEWFSVQHWVSVQQDGLSATLMPLDASLVTLGDINRGRWPTKFGDRPGAVFSYVMNNYWNTNYRASQGGHFQFRYVITSAASTDAAALSRLGWEEMTPLETDFVTQQDKAISTPRGLDGKQSSFLTVDDPNVLLDAWKPSEDGEGTILRFLDLGGTGVRSVHVTIPRLALQKVWETDAVEKNESPLPVDGDAFAFTIRPHQIMTLRIVGKLKPSLPSP